MPYSFFHLVPLWSRTGSTFVIPLSIPSSTPSHPVRHVVRDERRESEPDGSGMGWISYSSCTPRSEERSRRSRMSATRWPDGWYGVSRACKEMRKESDTVRARDEGRRDLSSLTFHLLTLLLPPRSLLLSSGSLGVEPDGTDVEEGRHREETGRQGDRVTMP